MLFIGEEGCLAVMKPSESWNLNSEDTHFKLLSDIYIYRVQSN